MYQLNVVSDGKINLEYSLTNVYPDSYLKDNAKLFISGAGRSDQVNLTLELKTSKFAGAIEAVIKDSTGNITTALVNPDGTTLNLLIKKNPNEKDFLLTLSSNGFFVPKEMPVESGWSDDARKLTYTVSQIIIK